MCRPDGENGIVLLKHPTHHEHLRLWASDVWPYRLLNGGDRVVESLGQRILSLTARIEQVGSHLHGEITVALEDLAVLGFVAQVCVNRGSEPTEIPSERIGPLSNPSPPKSFCPHGGSVEFEE